MEALQDDNGDCGMLCTEHPFKNNTPAGGICAFCLQEKLGKLVSSSFPIAVFPSSSSSSPSFRSDINVPTTTTAVSSTVAPPRMMMSSTSLVSSNTRNNNECNYHHYYSNSNSTNNGSNKSRILYLLGQKKKKKKDVVNIIDDRSKNMIFKRSKSTVTPRRGGLHFTDSDSNDNINSPHKQRGFWSFLYLQKHSQQQKTLRHISSNSLCASSVNSYPQAQRSRDMIVVEENGSPCHASFDRKVSRSRSVGCGSRSFSGDFFERISTGFGDCTLRRVESQREGKSKVSGIRGGGGGQDCIKERVRCGGLFSGFMITSSSSSSSSSSYWANSNNNNNNNSEGSDLKMTSAVTSGQSHHQQHSRSKSWGWALASPMRAFSKPSSKKEQQSATNKNQTPNLAAIPSLLSVRS